MQDLARPRSGLLRNLPRTILFALGVLGLLVTGCSTSALPSETLADPVIEFTIPTTVTPSFEDTQVQRLDGATLSGDVSVFVRDHPHLDVVSFTLTTDTGTALEALDVSRAPYLMDLDVSDLGDGQYLLTAEAVYRKGQVKVATAAFDVQLPTTDAPDEGDVNDPVAPEEPTEPEPTEPEPTDPQPTEPDPTDPTNPEEPTEPAPTEPEPTEPEPTEPAPTEPEPTEPEPTDPEPTEPAPTEPEPTEPEPTEPEPTEPEPTPAPIAATYYVAPTGSDGNDGRSPSTPFRTAQRAADVVQPGDVVALRGGIYSINLSVYRNGTSSAPIRWVSYPGERAIFDGSNQTPVESNHRISVTADWNVFENFEVRYGPQEGIIVNGGHDNVFRGLDIHGNHYSGILNYLSNRNLYEDIRVYDNYDRYNPYGRIGDDADGIGISSGTGNVLRRVQAFRNSDDGIDTWRSTYTIVEDSVAWGNGLGTYGNGNGIKAGGNSENVYTIVRRSVAYDNRSHGFDYNSGRYVTFHNNTSFNNGSYAFVAGDTTTLRNNIAYGSSAGLWGASSAYNSWDLGITDPRFVSTDPSSADFLTLRSDSAAIDAGIDVGLAYQGAAPDLGAMEQGTSYADLLTPGATISTMTLALSE